MTCRCLFPFQYYFENLKFNNGPSRARVRRVRVYARVCVHVCARAWTYVRGTDPGRLERTGRTLHGEEVPLSLLDPSVPTRV